MRLLDSITIQSDKGERFIELYHGDLTQLPAEHAVDVLVVSAFPNDYIPTRGSLIGALNRSGVSVQKLARDKEVDLRDAFSCWMSKEIQAAPPGIQFKKILCFEPLVRGRPSDVIGDIFQSLMPFVYGVPPIKSIAMPIVATGDQGFATDQILGPLLDAAVHWLALGLPVEVIKIVEYGESKAARLQASFTALKEQYKALSPSPQKSAQQFTYDFFISYAHDNTDVANLLYDELKHLEPATRIFIDRQTLKTGVAWQQELFEALDDCRKVIAMYSPAYLVSKVCKEEFNIALLRHRVADEGVLLPIYLYTTQLPSYMQLLQFVDCREGDPAKIRQACELMLGSGQ